MTAAFTAASRVSGVKAPTDVISAATPATAGAAMLVPSLRPYPAPTGVVVPLSTVEAAVLEYVDRHPGCRPSDVARELRMRTSNFSAALRVLEKQGFVERRDDPSDGRTANLVVTALAKRNIDVIRSRRAAFLAAALGDDRSRIDGARELLDQLRQ